MKLNKKYIALNNLIILQRGFDLPEIERVTGNIPVVASTGIIGSHNIAKVKGPGVVIGRSGSIGGGQYVAGDFWPLNTTLWVKDFKEHNPRFIYYVLKNIDFSRFNFGTGVPTLNRNHIANIKVLAFDKSQEEKISDILSKYDDLIENNRRRIELLERSARLLYKEWFVRLRFPGHEHTPIIDGIPEGWEKRPLSQICYDVRDSIKPQDLSPDMAYIGLEHMPRRSIALSEWGNAEDLQSNKFKFKKDDIIFGKIRPYFHKVGVACIDGVTSSDAIVIRSYNPQMYYYCLMLVSSDRFISITSQTVKEGSKMPRANWEFLLKNKFPVPSDALLKIFADTITPIIEQIKLLVIQIQKLKQARDILLPKLMNGEIEV